MYALLLVGQNICKVIFRHGKKPWQKSASSLEFLGETSDCLIGIRTKNQTSNFSNKPPTKLINAWLAGIPFIGGSESAYLQIGEPGKDYLVADTMEDAIEQIKSLKSSPELFSSLVRNSDMKAQQFSPGSITHKWADFIWNVIWPDFDQWKMQPIWMHTARYVIAPGYRLFLHKKFARLKKCK